MVDSQFLIRRRKTRKVRVGNIFIGGDSPITVQSMTNTDTRDVRATVEQIKRLEEAGCDIIRAAVPDAEAVEAVREIKKQTAVPFVADIHFDYRIAIKCIENGVDKVRINPGNIGDIERIRKVVAAARERGIPIRIGINSGSLEKDILARYGGVTPEGMVESADKHIRILEDLGFRDIIVALKASDAPTTIAACRLFSTRHEYPLHLGVTEAGTPKAGTVKSAVGIGSLLAEGIGDTIRVSLTGDPVEEIVVGIHILKSLGLRKRGIDLVSCPTCGRCKVNLIPVAEEIERRIGSMDKTLKVAVMGCSVNGPGEAREADIGIAGGAGEYLLFKKGEIIRKIPEDRAIEELIKEIGEL